LLILSQRKRTTLKAKRKNSENRRSSRLNLDVNSLVREHQEEKKTQFINDESSYVDKISNRVISEDDIRAAPMIVLEEIQGDIFKNNKLMINAGGLVKGERKTNDGIAFFGMKLIKDNKVINDYVLFLENAYNDLAHIFIIYYKKETNKYYLRSYKEKESNSIPLVMIKLESKFIIRKKIIIKANDCYFQIEPIGETH